VEIRTAQEGPVTVIAPAGRIDTTTAPALEAAIETEIAGGARRLLVDLSGVPYVSSMGLRILLLAAKRLRAPDDRFGLSGLAPEVEKVMRLTGFSSILRCFASRGEAIAALSA
jgi:anti-anti-sigma factor